MSMTGEEVLHIARLARLELSDDDVRLFAEQLGKILEYMQKLDELDTQKVEPTAHAITLRNVFRGDRMEAFGDPEKILVNSPDRKDDCFRVPKIIED
jgi:aspartyl-tRNA(Asn)/glutamyl-tRNA(Gln) amidotransferase subunit C